MNTKKDYTVGLTSQAAVEAVGNRYDLILIAARRTRELQRGDIRRITGDHYGSALTALLEIEQGKVGRDYLLKDSHVKRRQQKNHNI